MSKQIAPSLLSCDFGRLAEEISAVEKAGADILHLDVMDGHFVPNLTIGPDIVAACRRATTLILDVHLMILEPERYIEAFQKAGADMLSIHIETSDPAQLLPSIQKLGCKAGLVINPPTAVGRILPYLQLADYILVMTVNPGFGGQALIEECLPKITAIRNHLTKINHPIPIEVDGGITSDNIARAAAAGADILVAGSAIFKSSNYGATISEMKKALL